MKRLFLPAVIGLMLQTPVMADTLITEANLAKIKTVMPKLSALKSAYEDVDEQDMVLEQHCNWQKQYEALKAQQANTRYVTEVEQILAENDLKPAEFLELTLKMSWPMLKMTQQSLAMLAENKQPGMEEALQKSSELLNVITNCITNEDKQALDKLQQRINQPISGMSDAVD